MLRWLRNIFCAISLILCAVTLFLWSRSYRQFDVLDYRDAALDIHFPSWGVWSCRGQVTYCKQYGAPAAEGLVAKLSHHVYLADPAGVKDYGIEQERYVENMASSPKAIVRRWFGHRIVSLRFPPPQQAKWLYSEKIFIAVTVPYASLALVTSLLPLAFVMASFHFRLRRRPGLCVGCGYDLRASKGICPECGRAID
jgi:hypothetical protein